MKRKGTTVGQRISPEKRQVVLDLRRHMTPEEKALWEHLRANRFHKLHWRRQHFLHGFVTDFFCCENGLIVEVDGPIHEHPPQADHQRDLILLGHGFHTIRFTNAEVNNNINSVLARIAEACDLSPERGGEH